MQYSFSWNFVVELKYLGTGAGLAAGIIKGWKSDHQLQVFRICGSEWEYTQRTGIYSGNKG